MVRVALTLSGEALRGAGDVPPDALAAAVAALMRVPQRFVRITAIGRRRRRLAAVPVAFDVDLAQQQADAAPPATMAEAVAEAHKRLENQWELVSALKTAGLERVMGASAIAAVAPSVSPTASPPMEAAEAKGGEAGRADGDDSSSSGGALAAGITVFGIFAVALGGGWWLSRKKDKAKTTPEKDEPDEQDESGGKRAEAPTDADADANPMARAHRRVPRDSMARFVEGWRGSRKGNGTADTTDRAGKLRLAEPFLAAPRSCPRPSRTAGLRACGVVQHNHAGEPEPAHAEEGGGTDAHGDEDEATGGEGG